MFLAVKYVRKKLKERRERETSEEVPERPPTPTGGAFPRSQPQAQQLESDGPVNGTENGNSTAVASAVGPRPQTTAVKKAKEESPEAKAEKKRRYKYRLKIVFGLTFPFMLQALDTTIIASALPFIARDFNEVSQLNWIISSFNLTSAAFLPFWAQIADVFGRHATLHATIIIMTIGSAICTGAPTSSFGVLLLGRALQGVGAAGVNICVRTILADRVSLAEYAMNYTVFAIVSAISFSVGPVAGGYLTQVSWRWCFAINLPVAAVAIVLVVVLLRKELLGPQPLPELAPSRAATRRGRFLLRLATIDYGGQLLFLWGLGLVILALTWGGASYPWDSADVLAPLVIGMVLSAAWLLYQYAMVPGRVMARLFPRQRPMMPWRLLVQRNITLLFFINFSLGSAMFSIMYFMDLFFTLVQGNSASSSGIALLYFLPGLGVGAYTAIFFTNKWPRQTLPSLLLGAVASAVGITVIAVEIGTAQPRTAVLYAMMAIVGVGVGIRFNPGALHGLAYFPTMTAQISCLVSFAFPFGGTITLTLMSTVLNNRSGPNHVDPKSGIYWAFIAIVPIMWAIVIITTFLGNVWIIPRDKTAEGEGAAHEVVHGAYLWSIVRGKKLERVRMSRDDQSGVVGGSAVVQPERQADVEAAR
ncbi:major facilitator superfamily domain-containing protein [Lasiosphaeria miniovina]|uniref:Major facilitator superfamily domain-containing protein n=1 Tax=Lasiosphaeria miniovina TaxID=1954250 RepID=A0AA40ACF5_9PEZI|nr:major facilitator superfamily domain-containing protein [Lasiosphaeria miniovina]KAK0713185.1 major facilitator superfamily domain-containing protein [Lasiosphaeria miniovina]